MRKLIIASTIALFFTQSVWAQFSSITNLTSVAITTDTKEKHQSKVWIHDSKFWTVLTNSTGTHVWRLDGTTWTNTLTVSSSKFGRADCKVAGNVVHIFLFRDSSSYLVSIEYVPGSSTYKLWSVRTSKVPVPIYIGAETGTIDIDTKARMWMTSDTDSTIVVSWSDSPYANWSGPITVASGIGYDDIGAVIALPMLNKIGVFWSNQNTKRFGFKLHTDGTNPKTWSKDEIPSSQSAINIRGGMADDHMNMTLGSDGTLYCAVKTSYDKPGYPRIALLIRRPAGTWDHLYEVSEIGTRGVAVLNEEIGKLRIVYSENEDGGDILYKETSLSQIAFGPQFTLIRGKYNNSTSIKSNNGSKSVILASDSTTAVGVSVTDVAQLEIAASPNPFHTGSKINFTVPASSNYSVNLYNINGNLVSILKQGYAKTGETHTTEIEDLKFPFGLYILRLQTDMSSQTLKLIHN